MSNNSICTTDIDFVPEPKLSKMIAAMAGHYGLVLVANVCVFVVIALKLLGSPRFSWLEISLFVCAAVLSDVISILILRYYRNRINISLSQDGITQHMREGRKEVLWSDIIRVDVKLDGQLIVGQKTEIMLYPGLYSCPPEDIVSLIVERMPSNVEVPRVWSKILGTL